MLALILPLILVGFGLSALISDNDDTPPANNVTEGDDSITTGDGADLIQSVGGDDVIQSGGGNDTVFSGSGDDVVSTNIGDDRAFGSDGSDLMSGGAGNDFLRGGSDEDIAFGGAGEDTLFGDAGDDVLQIADIIDADALVDATRAAAAEGRILTDAEITTFIDTSADTGEADIANGGSGNDVIIAGDGDIVSTGSGDDVVNLGEWNSGTPTQITDYNPARDVLFYTYTGNTAPAVVFSEDDDGQTIVLANGQTIAVLDGVDFFDVNDSDIVLERLT